MKIICNLVVAFSLLFSASYAHSSLYDRGGGLIYDSTLDVTWLQDANYAQTSGYDADGLMDWETAKTWANTLFYFDSVRNVTYDDWRLPKVAPIGSQFNYNFGYDGTSDRGYNITSKNSEMGNLWYVSLGGVGYCVPDGGDNCLRQINWGLRSSEPFKNIDDWWYWSGTGYPATISSAWGFQAGFGAQDGYGLQLWNEFNAWAVRDGDVASFAAIPEPASLALFGVALFGGLAIGQRQRRRREEAAE